MPRAVPAYTGPTVALPGVAGEPDLQRDPEDD